MKRRLLQIFEIELKAFYGELLKQIPSIYLSVDKGLKKIIRMEGGKEDYIDPEVALNSIVNFWKENETVSIDSNEETIDLYVKYGSGNWEEYYPKTFQIIFVHQKISPINKVLYEHSISIIYDPNKFHDIEMEDIRLGLNEDIDTYVEKVKNSKGFRRALEYWPERVLIETEII